MSHSTDPPSDTGKKNISHHGKSARQENVSLAQAKESTLARSETVPSDTAKENISHHSKSARQENVSLAQAKESTPARSETVPSDTAKENISHHSKSARQENVSLAQAKESTPARSETVPTFLSKSLTGSSPSKKTVRSKSAKQRKQAQFHRSISAFESLPSELMLMVITQTPMADRLSLKLASKTISEHMPERVISSRGLRRSPFARCHTIVEAGYKRKTLLTTLICTICMRLKPFSDFTDAQCKLTNHFRYCISCGMINPNKSTYGCRLVTVGGEISFICGACKKAFPLHRQCQGTPESMGIFYQRSTKNTNWCKACVQQHVAQTLEVPGGLLEVNEATANGAKLDKAKVEKVRVDNSEA